MEFKIDKDFTVSKVKQMAKENVMETLMASLEDTYGRENVSMVRTGNQSKVNEIGVKIGQVTLDNGATADLVMTVSPTIKDFVDRKTNKKEFFAFNFEDAKTQYDEYIEEIAVKNAEKLAAKEAKIKRDNDRRAKATFTTED